MAYLFDAYQVAASLVLHWWQAQQMKVDKITKSPFIFDLVFLVLEILFVTSDTRAQHLLRSKE